MIPHELTERKIKLPETGTHSIVLITGNCLRHQRFAYRIQKEFGDLVLAWYQFETEPPFVRAGSVKERLSNLCEKVRTRLLADYKFDDIDYYIRDKGLIKGIKKTFLLGLRLMSVITTNTYLLLKRRRRMAPVEETLFQEEIEDLKLYARLTPILVKDPNSKEFIDSVKKLDPYFFLSLGGPLYPKELLESIRGIAINQHAGWSPTLKGSNTIEWALYHRSLNHVGSSVHITAAGADAGPILRRSHPCLMDNDTPESCFARVVALGTELIIEVVRDIMANKEVLVYDQPIDEGITYLNSQLDSNILRTLYRDFSYNWLKKELTRLRRF